MKNGRFSEKNTGYRWLTWTWNASLSTWLKSGLIVPSSVMPDVMPSLPLAPKLYLSSAGAHVLAGCLRVEHESGTLDVRADQAVLVRAGEWVRYSSPEEGGAEYVAVCLPAFTLDGARRDPD